MIKMALYAAKTIKELIYWKYAKIMSKSAGVGLTHYRFVWDRFKKLKNNEISIASALREYQLEIENPCKCIYCGSAENLSIDHLVPKVAGGPDIAENAVMACQSCNSSKGSKGLYEWFGREHRNDLPRIAEGKYLKLLLKLHEKNGTLEIGRQNINILCVNCKHNGKCSESLNDLCLEGALGRCNRIAAQNAVAIENRMW